MKAGITLPELAKKIEANRTAKADYVAPARQMRLTTANQLALDGIGEFTVTDHTHSQLAEKLAIPIGYYNRMRTEAPDLLAANVNHWFQKQPEKRHMVRTRSGNARAFLSDRYSRIDHEEIADAVLPILIGEEDLEITSCELTENRMYIKVVTPKITGEVKVGDEVQSGLVISNSEIGLGAVSVRPMVYRLVCKNGMISGSDRDGALHAAHIGAQATKSETVYQMLSDETLRQDDKVILMKVRDVTKAMLRGDAFRKTLDRMREAAGEPITTKTPEKTVEVLAKKTGLFENERSSVLQWLLRDGDLTRYGLVNAITRASQDIADYDRATSLEVLGSRILDMPKSEWRELAEAA